MRRRSPFCGAPGFPGAFALALGAFFASCEKQPAVPDWPGETVAAETAAHEAQPTRDPAPDTPATRHAETAEPLRFVAYNLRNWLSMDRDANHRPGDDTGKPEEEKQAAVALLAQVRPDALGVSEIGTREDLADLQQRLRAAGIDLPHAYHTGGSDDTRHLGFLSRFPLAATPHDGLDYSLEGRHFGMSRGILDVAVDAPLGPVRFLGAHLKSKREIPEADEERMRRAEARLLRREADRVLSEHPGTRLVVYGDMNDSRQSSALRILRGSGPDGLKLANLRDSRGESWTHCWAAQDVYSRFDYVLVTPNLTRRIEWKACRVLDDPAWSDASDHRPLLVVFE